VGQNQKKRWSAGGGAIKEVGALAGKKNGRRKAVKTNPGGAGAQTYASQVKSGSTKKRFH